MKIKSYIIAPLSFLMFCNIAYSQCRIDITLPTKDTTICAGDSVWLKSEGSCKFLMNNDFGNGTIGVGWSSTHANPVFYNPCGPGPGGWHLWVGTTPSNERTLVTDNYDVLTGNCVVEWYMRYGRVQPSGNCEDPDLTNEGVHLQYSTNNGTTWTDFPGPDIKPVGVNSINPPFITTTPGKGGYWAPVSGQTAQSNNSLYFWHKYSSNVPTAALSASTKFRWAQLSTSSTGFDAWGIDEVQISCGTTNQYIRWSHGANVLEPINPVYPTTTTNYVVVIFDSLGRIAYDTVKVTVISPEPDLGPDTIVCDHGTDYAIFDAGQGYDSYLWSTGATTQSITPNVTGMYSVTVAKGICQGADSVFLTMRPSPIADLGNDVNICIGDSTILAVSNVPGATYLWNTNDSTETISVNPANTTVYTVTVSNGYNCFDVDSVVVFVNPLPIADAGDNMEICSGDAVILKATGGVSFLWNTGETTDVIVKTPLNTTIYDVMVFDSNGCHNFDNVEVIVNYLPVVNIHTDSLTVCYGDALTLYASGANS